MTDLGYHEGEKSCKYCHRINHYSEDCPHRTLYNWTKTINLVRGIPGSGKSTLALSLVDGEYERLIENDDYWFVPIPQLLQAEIQQIAGPYAHHKEPHRYNYSYEKEITFMAAQWCGAEAFRRLRIFDEIAVANTFTKREYIFPWIDQCRKLGVNLKIHEAKTKWKKDPEQCLAKNVHNVPEVVIRKMLTEWEEITQAEVNVLLGK